LVLIQVGQAARNGRVELITGMTTLILDVDRVLIEYPEMRKYFGGGDTPTDEHLERARAIGMMMANTLDHVVEHLDLMEDVTQIAWRKYIADVYKNSPILKALLNEHGEWWPGLQKQVDFL
jgi:hypothetical protein